MNLFIYTGASRLNAAVVESATDLTAVSRLPDLIVGDSEPVTVKFLSASGAYESWSGGGTYTLSISIGALGGDGIAAYFQTSSFTAVTNGWTGRLNLASGSLPSVVAGYLADRPGAQSVPLFVQVRVTDADGNTETYARQAVSISGAVSVPTTANSTPVTYATAADVAADASTASAAAIAAAASASAAAGSASTAAGHVTTAGNSATAAAASAVTAGNSATTASGHATTATTQATNAATSASSASTYKDAAAVSAASATSSAGTATTQAALATTNGAAQVTLAAAQVTLATTQATNAGTSASAAAVSAAAALVSEAAALVSKNAAAASAATASAVSGSGNGTFSAAALTGVNSVTASASTALTLTGGSTGASLVLGQASTDSTALTANVNLYLQKAGASSVVFRNNAAGGYTEAMRIAGTTGNLLIGTTTDMTGSGGLKIAGTTAATTTTSGALIVAGGVGVSGAGYFGGNINTATAKVIGADNLNFTTDTTQSYFFGIARSGDAANRFNGLKVYNNANGNAGAPASRLGFYTDKTGITAGTEWMTLNENGNLNIATTTSASSSTVGALTIGNGTAATNVAIGGGNVWAGAAILADGYISAGSYFTAPAGGDFRLGATYARVAKGDGVGGFVGGYNVTFNSGVKHDSTGAIAATYYATSTGINWYSAASQVAGTAATPAMTLATTGNLSIVSTSASTGSTSGALQVAGGIYAGAASVFGTTGTTTFGATNQISQNILIGASNVANGQALYAGISQQLNYGYGLIGVNITGTPGSDSYTSPKTMTGGSAIEFQGSSGVMRFLYHTGATTGGNTVAVTEAMRFNNGAATFAGVVIKKNYTVATLPAAASYTYGEAYVSDATQAAGTSLGSAPTGGGSVKRGVYSDGSSWLLR